MQIVRGKKGKADDTVLCFCSTARECRRFLVRNKRLLKGRFLGGADLFPVNAI
jgi:hypothetical protein